MVFPGIARAHLVLGVEMDQKLLGGIVLFLQIRSSLLAMPRPGMKFRVM